MVSTYCLRYTCTCTVATLHGKPPPSPSLSLLNMKEMYLSTIKCTKSTETIWTRCCVSLYTVHQYPSWQASCHLKYLYSRPSTFQSIGHPLSYPASYRDWHLVRHGRVRPVTVTCPFNPSGQPLCNSFQNKHVIVFCVNLPPELLHSDFVFLFGSVWQNWPRHLKGISQSIINFRYIMGKLLTPENVFVLEKGS